MVIMIVLSSLGVDIGPLLAGAGVVGIAIGFGAQTLVRDIVSGVFFLLDDAFRVGEYIDLGNVMGTVEKISIRSMQLRHHRGALNTVPFGEIRYLTNYSRDWAIMKLEFRVTYDTDVALVKKIFKEINAALMANPEIAPNLLAAAQVPGRHEHGGLRRWSSAPSSPPSPASSSSSGARSTRWCRRRSTRPASSSPIARSPCTCPGRPRSRKRARARSARSPARQRATCIDDEEAAARAAKATA